MNTEYLDKFINVCGSRIASELDKSHRPSSLAEEFIKIEHLIKKHPRYDEIIKQFGGHNKKAFERFTTEVMQNGLDHYNAIVEARKNAND